MRFISSIEVLVVVFTHTTSLLNAIFLQQTWDMDVPLENSVTQEALAKILLLSCTVDIDEQGSHNRFESVYQAIVRMASENCEELQVMLAYCTSPNC